MVFAYYIIPCNLQHLAANSDFSLSSDWRYIVWLTVVSLCTALPSSCDIASHSLLEIIGQSSGLSQVMCEALLSPRKCQHLFQKLRRNYSQ